MAADPLAGGTFEGRSGVGARGQARGMQGSKTDVLKRLAYIEGHLKGIRRMVEEDQYCVDVLKQTYAVKRCFPLAVRPKLKVISNPIRAPGHPGERSAPPRIVAVGRLTHQKGFDILLAAFALIYRQFPEWQLDIWGEGADRPDLERLIGTLGLEGRAALRGVSPRPGSWVEGADIFVLSSRYEGFANALGEAMAAGLPVVSTLCDFGTDEMVADGYDGLLVATENPAALAQGMARLMNDAPLRERLGQAAAIAARRFAPENILPQWDDALAQVLGTLSTSAAEFHSMEGEVQEAAE